MGRECYDVVIVGAGVAGCSVAYHVARAGLKVALLDKGNVASEVSNAGAGMLAPLDDEPSDQQQSFSRLCHAGLHYYDHLDEELRHETGIDIELVDAPTLRPAFDESGIATFQSILARQPSLLPGLEWLGRNVARELEPLLPETVQGALLSPAERNVQVTRLTLAYARGAVLRGAHLFEGRPAGRLIQQGQRVIGVTTEQGLVNAEHVVLAAGAWAARWHTPTSSPPIFPVKGQMIALQAPSHLSLRHTIYLPGVGCILPKADGSIYVGSTSEQAGFDKTVTLEGISQLLATVATLAPSLKKARFKRAWAGLRPGSADGLPLIGPSQTMQGLWLANGLFRDGILLGPLTGHILATLIQGYPAPFGLDLEPFDPDRFGGWSSSTAKEVKVDI